jgi:hypothetical protein
MESAPPGVEYISAIVLVVVYGLLYSLFEPEEYGFKSKLDPWYFALTTMSTAGYGDFFPRTDRAKIVTMTQQAIMLIGSTAVVFKVLGFRMY